MVFQDPQREKDNTYNDHPHPNTGENEETRKTVGIFSWASFFNDMGSDMIYPIWPMFVTSFAGADMAILGFIDGLGDAIVSLSQALSGYLSDRFKKRKIFIWLGYLFAVLSRLGYALSSVWQSLIPFRILDRAGKIRGAPRDAIIAHISTDDNRGKNFGILRTMDNLGAVVGIIISILLFQYLGFKNLFLIACIPSIIGTLLIIFFIKEKPPAKPKEINKLSFKDFSSPLKIVSFLSAIFSLGSFSYSFLLIFAKTAGYKDSFIPILYLLFTLIAGLSSFPFGKISDKIGRKPVLLISFLLWGLTCIAFILLRSYPLLVPIPFILYGLHRGGIDTVQKTFVSELAPPQYKASVLGFFQMVIGLCALPSSLIAGFLWDKVHILAPFVFSIVLTLIASAILLFVNKK